MSQLSHSGQDHDQQQLHAIARGVVQGVNFRHHTRRVARALLLVGWVRNRADGSVEVFAEGPLPHLRQLVEFLRTGPPSAQVESLQVDYRAPSRNFNTFEIR
jgi:acylphosphatase